MKKLKLTIVLVLLFSLCFITGCENCRHDWMDATCETPKTCKLCNKTKGNALGHNHVDGICTICDNLLPGVAAEKLNVAAKNTESSNFTVMQISKVKGSTVVGGVSEVFEQASTNILMKFDGTNLYMSTTANYQGEEIEVETYTKKIGETYVVYQKTNNAWTKSDVTNELDYQQDSLIVEYSDEMFTYDKGLWVGNPDEINKVLSSFIDQLNESMGVAGIAEFKITKYNITLKGDLIDRIDMVLECSMSMEGVTINMIQETSCYYSNIGSTTNIEPSNLPA